PDTVRNQSGTGSYLAALCPGAGAYRLSATDLCSKYRVLSVGARQQNLQSLCLSAYRLDRGLDTVLLGLVDCMVTVCGFVHCAHFTGPDDKGVRSRRAAGARRLYLSLDDGFRR